MVDAKVSRTSHPEMGKSRIKEDEEKVQNVISCFDEWVNPFFQQNELVSISTARAAPAEVCEDLSKAHQLGEEAYAQFKVDRLETGKVKFDSRMSTLKLKTFSSLRKEKIVKVKGKEFVLKAGKALFGRIILVAQVRKVNMPDVLKYPLGPVPYALATVEGSICKTVKSTLASALQRKVSSESNLPARRATIIDGMSLVQKVPGGIETFGQIASCILSMAMKSDGDSERIDIVFDTYRNCSIKQCERILRGDDLSDSHHLQNIKASQKVRMWKEFLKKGTNKSALIFFLAETWKGEESRSKLHDKVLYVTYLDKCYKITRRDFIEVAELQSTHEEADGRLMLHALHVSSFDRLPVVIVSEDNDVLGLALSVHSSIIVPFLSDVW